MSSIEMTMPKLRKKHKQNGRKKGEHTEQPSLWTNIYCITNQDQRKHNAENKGLIMITERKYLPNITSP